MGQLFLNGTKYSRVDQVKFFKGCLRQILLGPLLNTLSQISFEAIFAIKASIRIGPMELPYYLTHSFPVQYFSRVHWERWVNRMQSLLTG